MRGWTMRAGRMAAFGLAMVLGSGAGGTAQSPGPESLPSPTVAPTPTADSGIDWPPMGFEGTPPGQPFSFTSDCGIWGQDPITLHGEGGGWTFDLVVTLDTYDAQDFQWFGTVTGTSVAPNGTTEAIDDPALVYYDMEGAWILVASWAAQIPAYGCGPLPSEVPPSGAPAG